MTKYSGNCVLFGAGGAGETALELLTNEGCNIIAVVDNDENKHGTKLGHIDISSPTTLGKELEFDNVLIASGYYQSIISQLKQYGISENQIIVLPLYYLKKNRFSDIQLNELAWDFIKAFAGITSKLGVRYWVDYGTLLGMVRDGELIPWDSDVDFSILEENKDHLFTHLNDIAEHVSDTIRAKVSFEFIKGVNCETSRVLIHCCRGEFYLGVDIFIKCIEDEENVFLDIMDRKEYSQLKYFSSLDKLHIEGVDLPIPNDVDGYLKTQYGEWKKPNKEWVVFDGLRESV